jgi:hypothetical protein
VSTLDTTALTEPVADPALTSFIADSKATSRPWQQITTGLPRPGVTDIIGQLVPFAAPVIAMLFFLYVGGSSLVEAIWEFTLEAPFPLNLVIIGVVALIVFGLVAAITQVVRLIRSLIIPRSWWEAAYRITRFATANGLRYGHDEFVTHPGVIFETGNERTATRRLTTTAGRPLEIANYRYTVPAENEKNSQVHHWGYVAITLDRRLPHLLLDAKANDHSVFGIRTSNLPIDLARDQRLSLGGEFDDKFTLYAPSDYGRDAFLIFAPDLMALFIDRLGTFDVEIVDDQMFVYGAPFDLFDPRTYAWLEELVATVVARTLRRTERYQDDFALLEADGAGHGHPGGSAGSGVVPAESVAGRSVPGQPVPAPTGPVFALGGDGPSGPASNTVGERGRRLRSRRWGPATILGVVVLVLWFYNKVLGPMLGLPTWDG